MTTRWTYVDGLRRAVGWPAAIDVLARRQLGLGRPVRVRAHGHDIALRPLDIEGAEREVCAAAREPLRQAACLMIEPHDLMFPGSGCLSGLYRALAGRCVDTLIRGENLIIHDSALVRADPAAGARRSAAETAAGQVPDCAHAG